MDIFPEFVHWVEATEPVDDALFATEHAYLSRAVASRRRDFTTVRACARTALAAFGLDRPPMVPGVGGAPPWPRSVVGSMTHTDGYAAAAVAEVERARSLGIDAEPDGPLPDGVLELITDAPERDHLQSLADRGAGTAWDRLVFSAKESVYKAWFQLRGEWLDFHDVHVLPEPDGSLRISPATPTMTAPARELITEMAGRWSRSGTHLVTGVIVPLDRRGAAAEQSPVRRPS